MKGLEHFYTFSEQGGGLQEFMDCIPAFIFKKDMSKHCRVHEAVANAADCHCDQIIDKLANIFPSPQKNNIKRRDHCLIYQKIVMSQGPGNCQYSQDQVFTPIILQGKIGIIVRPPVEHKMIP